MKIIEKALHDIQNASTRKSMLLNVLVRPLSIAVNIVYTPLLLNYLGEEKYGVWATILSILNWVNFCDIGIGGGLRNIICREIAQKKCDDVKKSVSTAYIVMATISIFWVIAFTVASNIIDWSLIFDVEAKEEISYIMTISFSFIAINFTLALGKSVLYAIQKSEIASLLTVFCSIIQLIGILCLKNVGKNNLIEISILFGASISIVYLITDIILAREKDIFRPSLCSFQRNKVKELYSLGFLFLVLQIGGIIMNSTDNILVARYFGVAEVTPFNTVFRFFNSLSSFYMALIIPIWSRTTKALSEGDVQWIQAMFKKINFILIAYSIGMIIISFAFKQISLIWLGRELEYKYGIVIITVVTTIIEMMSMTYSNIMNGLSLLKIQVVITIFQSVCNIPLSIYLCTKGGMGIVGIKVATIVMFIISSIVYCAYILQFLHKSSLATVE